MPEEGREALVRAFQQSLLRGESYSRINEARKQAEVVLNQAIPAGSPLTKVVDEAMEAAVVRTAPVLIQDATMIHQAYDNLISLLERQPTLSVHSSTSVLQQAYSTPIPIAYLAATLAGITPETTVYEPTVGNGALLITANPANVIANELNPERFAELSTRGYRQLTQHDANSYRPQKKVDRVICNPPFGSVRGTNGRVKRFEIPSNRRGTTQIDHGIAFRALEALKDDGRAVLILGGKLGDDEEKRSEQYNSIETRGFYYALYQQYNVTQHFSIWGSLYRKQGAGFPIDLIVIEGRGPSSRPLPAAEVPPIYKSFDALKELLPNEPIHHPTANPTGLQGSPPGLATRDDRQRLTFYSSGSNGSREDAPLRLQEADGTQASVANRAVDGDNWGQSAPNAPASGSNPERSIPPEVARTLRRLPDKRTPALMVVDSGVGRNPLEPQRNLLDKAPTGPNQLSHSDHPSTSAATDRGARHDHPRRLAKRTNLRNELNTPPLQADRNSSMAAPHPEAAQPLHAPYQPRSKGKSPGTLIPANMATAAQLALDYQMSSTWDLTRQLCRQFADGAGAPELSYRPVFSDPPSSQLTSGLKV